MANQRWLRIIPVALIMYTISYVDRTNVSLALDPKISTMMRDLLMDDKMKGHAAGVFFWGYLLLQIPGGWLASRWSPRKLVSMYLLAWGTSAVGCGLAKTFGQFELMRFLLGVAESGVFPACMVLLANWFPLAERARANAYWTLCQPLAIAATAPLTGWLLGAYGWQRMLIIEGLLPFIWLPIWWFGVSDHPRDAKWISADELKYLEGHLTPAPVAATGGQAGKFVQLCWKGGIPILILMYFLQNCAAYGCMTFFTTTLGGRGYTSTQYGLLFALPYAVTAVLMVLNSRHSDKTRERRGHVAAVYALSGLSLICAVLVQEHFWISYGFMCLAIPGPFAAMGPFWSIPGELLPRAALGLMVGIINAVGNLGGFAGPYITGWLKVETGGIAVPFSALGAGLLLGACLAFLVPRDAGSKEQAQART